MPVHDAHADATRDDVLLRATSVVVRHHPSLPPVLDGVDLAVHRGERIAVVGANGSGKSTLARVLAGLEPLESGSVVGAPGASGTNAVQVGLVVQDPAAQLVAATVADELALGPELAGRSPYDIAATVDEVASAHGLDTIWARPPQQLSGGQQQRVAIAAVAACRFDVLVLDEPGAMLGEAARAELIAMLTTDPRPARAVVWVTHDPMEVAACDRVIALDAGVTVWSGSSSEYLDSPYVATQLGLDLPAPTRVLMHLIDRAAAPGGVRMPRSEEELVELLVLQAGRRA